MESILNGFAEDVKRGLAAELKYLPSKYLYDAEGSKLFQSIMRLEEYYPTRCEYEILKNHRNTISDLFREWGGPFELVELGAGDGFKTRVLLQSLSEKRIDFTYRPVDISPSILVTLIQSVQRDLPEIHTGAITGEYLQSLAMLKKYHPTRKIILFLGSTIGNFTEPEAINFLKELRRQMNDNDLFVIGFDLQKHPRVIADAYNDKAGITRAFNLNILKRINRELGGKFDLSKFEHYPVYDPSNGEAKSYLVSSVGQAIPITKLNITASFKAGEVIYTEISKKYTLKGIEELARKSGFSIIKNLFDSRQYFTDSIWKPA